ncbi:hypothetical protein D3C72_1848990 [compost metagenome]
MDLGTFGLRPQRLEAVFVPGGVQLEVNADFCFDTQPNRAGEGGGLAGGVGLRVAPECPVDVGVVVFAVEEGTAPSGRQVDEAAVRAIVDGVVLRSEVIDDHPVVGPRLAVQIKFEMHGLPHTWRAEAVAGATCRSDSTAQAWAKKAAATRAR